MPDPESFAAQRLAAIGKPVRDLNLLRRRRSPLARASYRLRGWLDALTRERGLDTTEVAVELEHFHSERVTYQPSDWRWLRRALPASEVKPGDVFVDFGCGKGRVLLCAAEYPFARVIGVEISPRLSEIARRNVARARERSRLGCQDIEIVTSDVVDFVPPDEMTHAYFYYPFVGETRRRVLESITASLERRHRELTMIWSLPGDDKDILASGRFRRVRQIKGTSLDRNGTPIHVYRSMEPTTATDEGVRG
jgi:SAM-dependent methyltransferase